MGAGISGATVINGVDGFGRRGKSSLRLEGISIIYPLVIEVIDEQSKLDPLLPWIKTMVADNTRSVCTMISNNSIEFGRKNERFDSINSCQCRILLD